MTQFFLILFGLIIFFSKVKGLNMDTKIIKVFRYIIWILPYFALSISYPTANDLKNFGGVSAYFRNTPQNSLLSITLLILVIFASRKTIVYSKKQLGSWFASFIVSSFYVTTLLLMKNAPINILAFTISIIGFTIFFAHIFVILETYLSNSFKKNNSYTPKINIWFMSVILIVIWLIQVWPLLPGLITWDGYRQFLEFERTSIDYLNFQYYPTNHHPWASTVILGNIFNLGRFIGGANTGILLIVATQMLTTSLILSYIIKGIGQSMGKKAFIFTFIFYSTPIFAFWTVTVEKTSIFIAMAMLFVFQFIKIFSYRNILIRDYALTLISAVGMMAFRNDGIYIVFISLLVLVVYSVYKHRDILRGILVVAISFVLISTSWNYISSHYMNVKPGSTGEVLTIPMRQLTKVAIDHPDKLSKKDWNVLDKITPRETLSKHYNVDHADDLKSTFPVDTFLRNEDEIKSVESGMLQSEPNKKTIKDTSSYIKLWFKYLLKYPKTYISVFLDANKKFLNPMIDNPGESRGIMFSNGYMKNNAFLQPSWYNEFHSWFKTTNQTFSWVNILFSLPGIMFITSSGFTIWFILFSLGYLFNKKILSIFILTPTILLALVALLSPVDGMFRYIMGAFDTIPLILLTLSQESKYLSKNKK